MYSIHEKISVNIVKNNQEGAVDENKDIRNKE